MEEGDGTSTTPVLTRVDKEHVISNERMEEAWQKIYAPPTPDDETRVNMGTQNRRGGSRKALLTKYILLSQMTWEAHCQRTTY